ncbi:hypothetical protein PG994_014447 [Apiospora phragmitis]|uniref:Uncharacterized protein n=1 Tax=Apiospora phragmitis TaxID=2905665 RepID=A0ABR1T4B6_9PEZI
MSSAQLVLAPSGPSKTSGSIPEKKTESGEFPDQPFDYVYDHKAVEEEPERKKLRGAYQKSVANPPNKTYFDFFAAAAGIPGCCPVAPLAKLCFSHTRELFAQGRGHEAKYTCGNSVPCLVQECCISFQATYAVEYITVNAGLADPEIQAAPNQISNRFGLKFS